MPTPPVPLASAALTIPNGPLRLRTTRTCASGRPTPFDTTPANQANSASTDNLMVKAPSRLHQQQLQLSRRVYRNIPAHIPFLGPSTHVGAPTLGPATHVRPPILGPSTHVWPPTLGPSTHVRPPILGPSTHVRRPTPFASSPFIQL